MKISECARKGVLAFWLCLLITLAGPFEISANLPPVTDGLLVSLPLDGSGADASSNGYNATVVGGHFVADQLGVSNSAAHFDGSGTQRIVIPYSQGLYTPMMTVGCWARAGAMSQPGEIAIKGRFPDGVGEQWSLYYYPSGGGVYVGFSIKRNGNGQLGQNWYFVFTSQPLPNPGQWHCIYASWDGTTAAIYIDGALAGQSAQIPPGPIDNAALGDIILGRSTYVANNLNGDIGEFNLYNRALSAGEMKLIYRIENGGPASEPALAEGNVVNGFFVQASVTQHGFGYTNVPNVHIVGGGGTGASAVATVTNTMVASIIVTDPGSGYTNTPTVWIDPPSPLGATASASIAGGFVVDVKLNYPGSGYTSVPTVTLVGGGGTGAKVEAIMVGGAVTGFMILDTGNGYTSAPIVRIDPPAALQGSPASLDVAIKSVRLLLHVSPTHRYVVEGTRDFVNWFQAGSDFVADSPTNAVAFDVADAPSYYRLRDLTYNP